MSDNRRSLNSVYNDFFGEETKKEILEGTKNLLQELGDDIERLAAAEPKEPVMEEESGATPETSVEQIEPSNPATPSAGAAPVVESTEEKKEEKAQEQAAAKEDEEDPMEELNSLIGLDNLKTDVEELVNLMKLQKMREERGMKAVSISKHLVFSGNPGTGKTTVARILAKLYKQAGILSKGQLVEVDRSGLVAGYVGQTAIKTREKIQEALGGILFVDEAYALVKEGQDYGQEAIDTILKAMEDNRKDFVVIVAGYPDLMKTFIESNPGLKSRFNKYFYFEDYNEEELMKIFEMYLKKNDYKLSDEARPMVEKHIKFMVETKDSNFANARDVRNYFEHIINRQASRAINIKDATDEDLQMITPDDLKFGSDVFKWCFIGSGSLANTVADQLAGSEKHDIVSVYSRNEETGKAFAEKFQCGYYSSIEEAVNAKGVDGVYVVTPHTSHFEHAKIALEAGKPVLLEKPFTVAAKDTKALFDLAKEKNVYLTEAMWTWYSPIANRVKFWLDLGLFGEIKKVHINYHFNVGPDSVSRLTDPNRAGGALLDIGVYPLTYLYRLFGKPEKMECKGVINNGVDDGEEITLTFANGLTATTSISMRNPDNDETLIIEGTAGSVVLPKFHYADSVTLKRFGEGEEDITFEGDGSWLNEFNQVAYEIASDLKESPLVPHSATIDVMEMMDECRKQMGLVYPFEQ
ncbi:MAG: Gfo/Idh/MocA family oxidoreductase [Lachnospiraceae bacterium]|nr:Gfo/Idh/MocA family oxidoreductase [Lachnospiraceae bacterium]